MLGAERPLVSLRRSWENLSQRLPRFASLPFGQNARRLFYGTGVVTEWAHPGQRRRGNRLEHPVVGYARWAAPRTGVGRTPSLGQFPGVFARRQDSGQRGLG